MAPLKFKHPFFYPALMGFCCLLLGFTACDRWGGKKSQPGPGDKIYSVSVTQGVEQEIPDSVQAEGQFAALNRLEIKSDFTGKVQALSVEEGQTVYAGDVLMKIEDERLPWTLERQRTQLREAEAQLDLDNQQAAGGNEEAFEDEVPEEEPLEEEAQEEFSQDPQEELMPEEEPVEELEGEEGPQSAAFQRLARLRRQAAQARRRQQQAQNQPRPAAPPQPEINPELAQSRETLNQAKIDRIRAEIAETERQLDGSTITSGIDGLVTKLSATEGSMVKPQDLLVEVVTLNPIELSLRIPKEDVGKIDRKMKVKVTIPDLANRIVEGEISYVGPSVDPVQKSVEVRVRVVNQDEKIKIGMEGMAYMAISGGSHEALMVPRQAIVQQEGKTYLYVQENGVARKVEVETGSTFEDKIEIKRGLDVSDPVVVQGVGQLQGEEEFIQVR